MINVNLTNIDFNINNITFVDGLTLETVKMKYHWLLNASVKDAIIGQDSYGLVWYFGEWVCGEWYDGTWYSGTFTDGVWKNGKFYAYVLDKFQVLSNNFNILERDDDVSHFINGIWENGTFYSGKFGTDSGTTWDGYELYSDGSYFNGDYPVFRKLTGSPGGNTEYDIKILPTWEGGTFISGFMYDCVWVDGVVRQAYAKNIQWLNGKWFGGQFDGNRWWDGTWYNGSFISGTWSAGTFTWMDKTVPSRFGETTLSGGTICTWVSGTWRDGEFMSGVITDSGGTIQPSVNHYISVWEDGTWFGGTWFGGHFKRGTWKSGLWRNGVFGNISSTDWVSPRYAFQVTNGAGSWVGRTGTNTTVSISTQDSNYVENGISVSMKSPSTTYDTYDTYSSLEWVSPNYDSYFSFSFIDNDKLSSYNTGGTVFSVGSDIYVDCPGKYTGYATVTAYYRSATIKYIKIDKISGVPFYNSNGRAYIRLDHDNYIGDTVSGILGFRDFGFDLPSTKIIRGYQVKCDRKENYTGVKNGVFRDDYTWFNVGVIRRVDNTNVNLMEYDPDFYALDGETRVVDGEDVPVDKVIEGYKNKQKVDKVYREVIYGGFSDQWTLQNLSQHAGQPRVTGIVDQTHKNDIMNLLNVDVSDPVFTSQTHLIDTVDEVINLYMRYKSTNSDGKTLVLGNVSMRLFFEDVSGSWEGGVWENGTWVNGTFGGGKFLAGLWLNGSVTGGQVGGL